MSKILVSNIGFGQASPEALQTLQKIGTVTLNSDAIRFSEQDFIERISETEILIAGTEKITRAVFEHAAKLKLIARVGVGIDNINLDVARERKISICYTPDAPATSVPEFTMALMLNLLKGISLSDRKMHEKVWYRPMGEMLSSMKFGVVGSGKIGSKVIQLLRTITPSSEIFYYDPLVENSEYATKCTLDCLFAKSDLISLHLPLSDKNYHLVDTKLINCMQRGSYLINTSRGGIVDEDALYAALKSEHLAGAAIDVFETEPYQGRLSELNNCLLTSHLGSLTKETRALMEIQVVEDIARFLQGQFLLRPFAGFDFTGY